MVMYVILNADYIFDPEQTDESQNRLGMQDLNNLLTEKTRDCVGNPKLTYMNGIGVKFLKSLLEVDSTKRFNFECLNKESPIFNQEF